MPQSILFKEELWVSSRKSYIPRRHQNHHRDRPRKTPKHAAKIYKILGASPTRRGTADLALPELNKDLLCQICMQIIKDAFQFVCRSSQCKEHFHTQTTMRSSEMTAIFNRNASYADVPKPES
uniref:Putative E3 ubiquitin-protein ligase COP1 n=1 Tax=Davidia involucrata TaxID=16924 RepID=A0A5B7ASA7_DAVIN